MISRHRSAGFTLTELLAVLLLTVLVLSGALPVLAQSRSLGQIDESLKNLTRLGAAHVMYAADYNGRQYTNVVDDLSTYGPGEQYAYPNYYTVHGHPHPPILLGEGNGGMWGYWMDQPGNWGMGQPLVWPGGPAHLEGFGAFRLANAKPLHDYVMGKFYEPTFYPPNDTAVYAVVEPLFDDPDEFVPAPGVYWTSYCLSPAAMFHPDVMRGEAEGGWRNPFYLVDGFESPGLSQAMYPHLKTQLIEHHWNQQRPMKDPCNPYFNYGTYDDCEPYYFNHGVASAPAALFYDLSARILPNTEVIEADRLLIEQTGYGLWNRSTPFGEDGHFGVAGYDLPSLAHHILTTDGILGRDTIEMGAARQFRPERTHAGTGR